MSCTVKQAQQAQTNCSNNMGQPAMWAKDTDGCCKLYDTGGGPDNVYNYPDKSSCLAGQFSGEQLNYPCTSDDVGAGIPASCYNSCENFVHAPVYSWARPSTYDTLNQTWSPQKPYQL